MCLGQSDLTLVSLSAMTMNRSSGYVKDNDVRYGLMVAHRDPKSSKVTGLQCRGCIAFGWEEKVELKRKAATTIQRMEPSIPSVMILLRTIFATNSLVNELYTRLSNPLLSALHSSMAFQSCSRTHAGVMQAKHLLFIKQL